MVSSAAVGLKERQVVNATLDRQKKILGVAGLLPAGEARSRDEIQAAFKQRIEPRVVELATGAYAPQIDPTQYDQQKATRDPKQSQAAPSNPAQVQRLPRYATVYLEKNGERVEKVILPVEGKGLWSTMYGFVALSADLQTIEGLTFYSHGETPGLGGEIDNPRWLALWPGRRAFDAQGAPAIEVIKGAAGPPSEAPYQVDGLSGATITARGVTYLLHFWLGENGFRPFLSQLQDQGV
jgi:Na+-transporting NADH:ubiquinone oxidoreductase subunit C